MTRSSAGAAAWRNAVILRAYAMEPLRQALKSDGREGHKSQAWLRRQLKTERGIDIGISLLGGYLRGYTRIPRHVLEEACSLAGLPGRERTVLSRIADEALLLQPARGAKGAAKGKRKRTKKSAA